MGKRLMMMMMIDDLRHINDDSRNCLLDMKPGSTKNVFGA
jgi:hypothetical protein